MSKIQKFTLAAVLVALGVVLSAFYIPIGASKCMPIQHMVNVVAAMLLGPWYAVAMAFATSLIRFMLGTGTLLAFPGSMVGALLSGVLFSLTRKQWTAYAGELIGTSVLGGMLSYPIAAFIMGREAALFAYVLPFFISSFGGCVVAFIAVNALKKAGAMQRGMGML